MLELKYEDYLILYSSMAYVIILIAVTTIECGELRDKNTGEVKKLTCIDRIALWFARNNYI